MHRVAPLLLLSGVVLLVSWAVAPAAPSPYGAPAPPSMSPLDQAAPILADMSAELDRLKSRLDATEGFAPPVRDPFRFGAKPERVRSTPKPTVVEAAPTPPAPELPKLLAIVANDEQDGATVRSAVFAVGDAVHVLKIGDAVDVFVIRSIAADSVELVESATGASHRLSLR